MDNTLITIVLCSNKIDNFKNLIHSLEETVSNQSQVEVIVGCDKGEKVFKEYCNNYSSGISIKYHDIYVGDLYNQHNIFSKLLKKCSNNSYYVLALADDMIFKSKNWDIILEKYKHYYSDDIFRLRLGWRKNFSYSDYWQCISMPEDIDVCTKKWRDLVGDIPCYSIDSYNQSVMYYLQNFDKFNNNFRAARDIPVNNIEMKKHLSGAVDDRRILKKMFKCWRISVSYKMQSKASETAAKIYSEIISGEKKLESVFVKYNNKYVNGDIVINYKLSFFKIFITNIYRSIFYLEYGGGGFNEKISNEKFFSLRWLLYVYFNIKKF